MNESSSMTKQRLSGKVESLQIIPHDQDDAADDAALLQAIQELKEKIGDLSLNVDLSPVTDSLGRLLAAQDNVYRKRKWKHTVTYNASGDVSEIISTEI